MNIDDFNVEQESGDCVYAPDQPGGRLDTHVLLSKIAASFWRVLIDWEAGNRWVEVRIAKAVAVGYSGFLLEAEHALRDNVVLVSISDDRGESPCWIRFYHAPDTDALELRYESGVALERCRTLASKLATVIGYDFVTV